MAAPKARTPPGPRRDSPRATIASHRVALDPRDVGPLHLPINVPALRFASELTARGLSWNAEDTGLVFRGRWDRIAWLRAERAWLSLRHRHELYRMALLLRDRAHPA